MKSKKRYGMLLLTGLLLIGMVISSGCIGGEEEGVTPETESPESQEEATDTQTTESEDKSDISLSDLLDKAKGVTSVKYEMVMTGSMGTVTSEVWVTDTKTRTESTIQGQKSIMIMDTTEQVMYTYLPDQNMAMKIDLSSEDSTEDSPMETIKSIEELDPRTIGVDTLDGKLCTVVEYETTTDTSTATTKMWIWQRHGFPIRMESTTSSGEKITMEIENIEFGPISDSMFELPAGVDIQELPAF